jgi:hypothetical protein
MGQTQSPRKSKRREFNGHPSWSYWNVSMWLGNDYSLYTYAAELCRAHGKGRAAKILYDEIGETLTPDGARFSKSAIRHGLRYFE